MKLNRIFFTAGAVVLTFLPFLPAKAQQTPLVQDLSQIYVTDVSIPQRSLKAGDTVKGTFTLLNNGRTNAPDVSYLVALVGDFKNDQPMTVFEKKDIGTTFLKAGERKSINFSYELPTSVTGELGIRIQTVFAGLYMGWKDAKIAVLGETSLVKIVSAKLMVDGKEFLPETGPTVPKGKTVDYAIKFFNPTGKTITFAPRVRIYDRLTTGSPLREFSGENITVRAEETVQTILHLPTFNDTPLVYVGEVDFVDSQGELRAPNSTFRYLVLGDMATIQSVAADKVNAAKGETINVTVFYQPPPFNLLTRERPAVGEADLLVTVYDGHKIQVGSAAQKINLDDAKTSAVLRVTAKVRADSLAVAAAIVKDGVALSRYNARLTPPKENGPVTNAGNLNLIFIIIALVAMISVAVAFLLSVINKQKNAPPDNPPPPPPSSPPPTTPTKVLSLAVSMFLTAAALATVFGGINSARAFTVTGNSADAEYAPRVFVNSPIDGEHFAPGSAFNLQVRQEYAVCGNIINADTTWTVVFNGVTRTYNYPVASTGSNYNLLSDYSLGSFTAPVQPGDYKIKIKVDNYGKATDYATGKTKNFDDWTEGYITIHVDDVPSLSAPVLNAPTEGPGGGSGGPGCFDDIKLTWSAVTGASKYEIYRDGSILAEVAVPTTTYTDSSASPGSHAYYVVAVAGSSRSGPSNTVSANKCSPEPRIDTTVVPSPNPSYRGGTVTWTATPFGECSGPFSYSWTGDDSLSGVGRTVPHAYSNTGSYSATVTVTAPNCLPITKESPVPVSVILQPAPDSITCSGSPRAIRIGETVTWTAVPNPAGDYTYEWTGDDGLSGNTQTITKAYGTVGVKSARVSLVGVASQSECSATIRVQTNPNYQEI